MPPKGRVSLAGLGQTPGALDIGPAAAAPEPTAPAAAAPPAVRAVPDPPADEPQPRAETETGEEAAPKRRPAAKREPKEEPTADEPHVPLYQQLQRKEVRFTDAAYDNLTTAARGLQRRRPRGHQSERITENTLVRVAVQVLLEHADGLTGFDEAEILESYRAALRKKDYRRELDRRAREDRS